jgi:periplasmic divalent cation tolerance protein
MRIVYLTAKDSESAKKISKSLLKKKLIACANIFPVESMYSWQGKIEDVSEYVILAKTTDSNFGKVEKAVNDMHGYDVPAIYSWKADKVSKRYSDWIKGEVKN